MAMTATLQTKILHANTEKAATAVASARVLNTQEWVMPCMIKE